MGLKPTLGLVGTPTQLAHLRNKMARVQAKKPAHTGRPKRDDYVRFHVTLDASLASYLEEAWRNHRRPDGELASGKSAFIEDLIATHRKRNRGDR